MPVEVTQIRLGELDAVVVDPSAAVRQAAPNDAPAVHASGDAADLTVVLCHGFGAPGDDLVELAAAIPAPAGTRFVFPAAPLRIPELGPGARAWWWADIAGLSAAVARGQLEVLLTSEPPGLAAARAALLGALGAVRERFAVPSGRMVIGGFSQGAIVAADVAFRSETPLGGLILWSGMPFALREWRVGMDRRRGLQVIQSHGTADPILPYRGAERLRDELATAGLTVRWVTFPGGHGIGPGVLEATGALLRGIVATDAQV